MWKAHDGTLSITSNNTYIHNNILDDNKDINGGILQCSKLQKVWKSEEDVITINPILDELNMKVIIDSGATNHMFPDIDVFYEWEEFDEPRYVYFFYFFTIQVSYTDNRATSCAHMQAP